MIDGIRLVSFRITSLHYSEVIRSAMASQITDGSIVCSAVCKGADQRKHQSSTSLAFAMGNPPDSHVTVRFPHKGPVTRNMISFDDVIMDAGQSCSNPIINEVNLMYIPRPCHILIQIVPRSVIDRGWEPNRCTSNRNIWDAIWQRML